MSRKPEYDKETELEIEYMIERMIADGHIKYVGNGLSRPTPKAG